MAVRILGSALLAGLLAACASITEPVPEELIGTWITAEYAFNPQGHFQRQITFTRRGRFTLTHTSYGLYEGQPANEVSGFSESRGRFQVTGDRVDIQPESLTTWDRFWNEKPRTEKPHPFARLLEDCRYELRGDSLVLTYITFPADAPEITVMTLTRRD